MSAGVRVPGVPTERGRWACLVARVAGRDLLVLAFGHDGMVDALAARIKEGEDG